MEKTFKGFDPRTARRRIEAKLLDISLQAEKDLVINKKRIALCGTVAGPIDISNKIK
jgi:hypothetical protein